MTLHITDRTLPPAGRDGQHDPGEIPGLLEPISNDAADLVIGFRSFGQMPFYRRFGRAVLDHVTGAGGAVTDSQSGFRALNLGAVGLLVGTLIREGLEALGMGVAEDIK